VSLVRVIIGPMNEPPFTVDAIGVEDDTYNVLSANPEFHVSRASITEAVAALDRTSPHALGAVIVKPGRPLILQAIVHDLSHDPTCVESSVQRALAGIFEEAERRKLKSVALAAVGTRYRSIDERRFLDLFNEALAAAAFRSVEKVWLVVPEGFGSAAVDRPRSGA
jgi:O-acetyl-ADP-ribose deacetylase (regulator of RNase III)